MDPFNNMPTQQQPQQEEMSWWFKWLIKGSSVILGFLALVLGIVTTISFSASCLIAGILLICGSVLVLAFEVPMCCSFIEFIRPLSQFSEGRPHWQKCAIYMIAPIVTILLCQGASSIFGALFLFGVAGLYFMLTVGKKAPLEEMRSRAYTDSKANLTTNDQLPK
ncbi:calcium channel flower isoform X1 [Brachionus plicatilis]|uniref:Calcium channel flower isoform X1 n=1 Tax=Brachionus plicatilis TaxID=10195 RepID=A0A3M7SW31_BRAPC|nr:calcium channel flower isoform X1 [Brachionus plicatilis]